VRLASRSVVRVLGSACGLAIEGSGWVAEPGVVVTNAHVVAGEQDTTVEAGGQAPGLPAQAIAFDPTDDVAVLRIPELGLSSLSFAPSPPAGDSGAILGYPENGPFDVQPGRIGRTQTVITQNAYGQGPVSRLLTPLRGTRTAGQLRRADRRRPGARAQHRVRRDGRGAARGRLRGGQRHGRGRPARRQSPREPGPYGRNGPCAAG